MNKTKFNFPFFLMKVSVTMIPENWRDFISRNKKRSSLSPSSPKVLGFPTKRND